MLPADLFDRVCSFLILPVYDTLLLTSAACRQWSQLLDGSDAGGRVSCWRHVPPLTLTLLNNSLLVSQHLHGEDDSHRRDVKPSHYESALHALRRVRSIVISVLSASLSACLRFLDLLFPPHASSSADQSSPRVWLDHLTVIASTWLHFSPKKQETEQFRAALSRCLLRCPPLRSAVLMHSILVPTPAALRQLCSSGRLLHLEVEAEVFSTMCADSVEEAATRPWRGAQTVQSLVFISECVGKPSPSLAAFCAALPALTHLHFPLVDYHADEGLQYLGQHLGDRLTFLRLGCDVPLSQSVAMQLTALRSLYLNFNSILLQRVDSRFHFPPALSELTIFDVVSDVHERGQTVVIPPVPSSLIYLQVRSRSPLLVSSPEVGAAPVDVIEALPPSLLCLSLILPSAQMTEEMLTSLPSHCSHLACCHISIAATDSDRDERENRSVQRTERLQLLRRQLSAAVWCETAAAVQQQRLDKQWQREAGVQVWGC